jgi:hypothetical protein
LEEQEVPRDHDKSTTIRHSRQNTMPHVLKVDAYFFDGGKKENNSFI